MRRTIAWTLPVLLLIGLAALAFFIAVPNVEDDLESQANQVLADNGYGNVQAEVNGRDARLTGLPNDTEEAETIAQLIADNVDGVRTVVVPNIDEPTTSPLPGDQMPNLVLTVGDDVSVTGTLATNEQRDRIRNLVNELFGTNTTIELRTNPNFDEAEVDGQLILVEPIFRAAADGGLAEGMIELERRSDNSGGGGGYQLTITGTAQNEVTYKAIEDAAGASGIPGGLENVGIAESISPLFTGEELEPELLIIKLLTLRYEQSEVALTEQHATDLADLVETMAEFPTIDLTVVGHRSSIEGPVRGERRALVVFNELLRLGVDEQRLSLRDAGDLEAIPGAEDNLNARVTFEPVARSTS